MQLSEGKCVRDRYGKRMKQKNLLQEEIFLMFFLQVPATFTFTLFTSENFFDASFGFFNRAFNHCKAIKEGDEDTYISQSHKENLE